MAKYQLETYFKKFVVEVLGLKARSAEHYNQALRTVSRYLREIGLVKEHVFEIESLHDLQAARDRLLKIPDFMAQDHKGKQMYSIGFKQYLKFAEFSEGKNNAVIGKSEISKLDTPMLVSSRRINKASYGWNRDRIIVEQVLKAAEFKCEINPNHVSFVAARNNLPYLEGHHLIPISEQPRFENSLDVYANIVGLCPNCHRQLHFGRKSDIRKPLIGLYEIRTERLARSGITLSKDEFLALLSVG